MRPPTLPLPTAQLRPAAGSKSARKAPNGASTNRAAHKAMTQDSGSAHKAGRRKSASAKEADAAHADDSQQSADFAALLVQTGAVPATPAPTQPPAAGSNASGDDPLATDTATALLRPWAALATPVAAAGASKTDVSVTAAGAANSAATAATELPAAKGAQSATAGTPAISAAEAEAAAGKAGALSIPTELASTSTANSAASVASAAGAAGASAASAASAGAASASAAPAKTSDVPASGAHRGDARATAKFDQTHATAGNNAKMLDVSGAAGATSSAGSAGQEQSTGDSPAGHAQPDFAGAVAAGMQHSPAGVADQVSEAPMPAHTVAPTIAQVAHSLRTSGDGTSRLVIRLDPVELGPVLVSLRMRGGAVDISVRADNAGGATAVADQRAHIQQVLADHGLDLSSFNVSGGDASGSAGSSTTDAGMSDSSADNSSNSNNGSDANAANYEDMQAQAFGADGETGERHAFGAPRENAGVAHTTGFSTISDGAATAPVRTVRREGTWL